MSRSSMNSKKFRRPKGALIWVLILVCVSATQCTRGPVKMREVGEQAPNFALKSLSGTHSGLKDLQQNGFVLINFWASWCAPCKAEVPVLNEIHRKFQNRGLTVVGIDVEERSDTVSTFYRKRQMQYLVLLDSDGAVAKRYGVLSYPMTVVVDQRGKILFRDLKVLNGEAIKRLETITTESTSRD